jgi:hypothetical protein
MGQFPNKATQFKPGNRRGGKPKGTVHIKTLASRLFNDPDTWDAMPENLRKIRMEIGKDKTYGQALIIAWLAKAFSDPRYANIIVDLMDGKSKQELEPGEGFLGKLNWEITIVEPKPLKE